MNFKPLKQYDLTKTDATTIVAYRDNRIVSEDSIIDSFPLHLLTSCQLARANKSTELILNKIFGVHHDK
tara:strand:- start:349 stop:555 length:207 start_codon:yes stop_codon:yes gene_type:complete